MMQIKNKCTRTVMLRGRSVGHAVWCGVLIACVSLPVLADNINMSFNGNILTGGCTVDTSTSNQTVSLGTVGATQFTTVGDRASPTPFAIKLGNCPAGTNAASVTFTGTADDHDGTVLGVDSGGAGGVGIEISDITGSKIPLGSASSAYGLITTGDNILSFTARYVATVVPVSAGAANSTAQFTVNYN